MRKKDRVFDNFCTSSVPDTYMSGKDMAFLRNSCQDVLWIYAFAKIVKPSKCIIVILTLYCYINLNAQEHLSGTLSFSAGYILNPLTEGKGINFAGHYHLNGYDELRFGGYAKREFIGRVAGGMANYDYAVKLGTYLLSFDFAKGLKLKSSTNIYLGGGVTGGYEQANDGEMELETGERLLQVGYTGLVGFRLFVEFEVALARKFSLSGRVGQQFLFSGSGTARFGLILGVRIYL